MTDCLFMRRVAAESGIVAWDCKYNEEVLLAPYGLFWGGDNPMQAEECSHAGLACNYFCRTCKVGGTKEFKASDEGYNQLFSVSCYLLSFAYRLTPISQEQEARTPSETAAQIQAQALATTQSGSTEKVKKMVTTTGIRDTTTTPIINVVLDMGKKLRKRESGQEITPEADIQAKLVKALDDCHYREAGNPLIGMAGEQCHVFLCSLLACFWQELIFIVTHQRRFCTRFCLV